MRNFLLKIEKNISYFHLRHLLYMRKKNNFLEKKKKMLKSRSIPVSETNKILLCNSVLNSAAFFDLDFFCIFFHFGKMRGKFHIKREFITESEFIMSAMKNENVTFFAISNFQVINVCIKWQMPRWNNSHGKNENMATE